MHRRLLQLVGVCVLVVGTGWFAKKVLSADERARKGIEQLLRQDREATLSDKADELEKLWDPEAVRIRPGRPAEVGRQAIYDNDKRWEAKPGRERIVCYVFEIQDLQIHGNWAFAWSYFSYKTEANGTTKIGQGKFMHVMRQQPDGSWKFAREMGIFEKDKSAAPVSKPCE
jgi:ketosteroid isomerase-like protein